MAKSEVGISKFRTFIEGAIAFVLVMLSIYYLGVRYGWPTYLTLILSVPILVGEWLFMTSIPEIRAYAISKRKKVAIGVLIISVIACFGTLFLFSVLKISITGLSFFLIIRCILQGIIIGVVLRILAGMIFVMILVGKSVGMQKILFLLGFLISLWLFPYGETQLACAPFYVIGIGLGFIVHFSVRTVQRGRAKRNRYIQNLERMLGEEEKDFTHDEGNAIMYFAKQSFTRLEKLLEKRKSNLSPALGIIKSSMKRIQGDYHGALDAVDEIIRNSNIDKKFDVQLHCRKALSLGEIDGREKEMFDELQHALNIQSQKGVDDCILARITRSLRFAEKLSLEGKEKKEDLQKPLDEIWTALKLNEKEIPKAIDKVIGIAVPITWTLLIDSYGYALLKFGHRRLSRSLLTQCIHEDPDFSSPYLHLGEWHLTEGLRLNDLGKHYAKEKADNLARLCLLVAKYLEGQKDSRIKRRAEELLDQYWG